MLKSVKLQTKLLTCGVMLTVVPLLVVSVVVITQNARMVKVAEQGNTELAYADLDHIAKNIFSMCEAQQELLQVNVNHSLNVARDVLRREGEVGLSDDMATWEAINQYTKSSSPVTLPKMMVGETWLGQNKEMSVISPVVDQTMDLTNATCTIFQRMNDAGDMLRVCTNVQKTDGTRAIGTYIPKTNPDGTANPVVSTVLRGETFRGRAYVVNRWYITAYEPIFDEAKRVAGVLYVGIPQESVASVRQAIMTAEVGKTGYVYVIDSKGNYVISHGGKRDGESIWEARDSNGTLFIQEICRKAAALEPGEIGEQRYPWKNKTDAVAREKIARITYFEPWDWIIGIGSYIDEFYDARDEVKRIGTASDRLLGGITVIALLVAIITWFLIARRIAGRIARVVEQLSDGADQVASASGQVSSASQSLAQGATEQAAGLEETSSSLEEMASMTRQNADNAQQANALAMAARRSADTGNESMGRMDDAIQEIQRSADETAKIIKVIDDIAFQTNLLALNAAVEAARAGEAGKGFAVVAEEVRNLAMRSAEAAKNTSNMIEESVKNAKNGVGIATEVGGVLKGIVQSVGQTTDLVSEIAAASQEQAQGIDQINNAVNQMDQVTQQSAANAEESASASEQLSAQAESMNDIVLQLVAIVDGKAVQGGVGGVNSGRGSGPCQGRDGVGRTPDSPRPLAHSDHTWHQIAEPRNKPPITPQKVPSENAIYLDTETELNEFNS